MPQSQTQTQEDKKFFIISFAVPIEWKPKIERLARSKGYFSVSEFLRDLVREQLEKGDQ